MPTSTRPTTSGPTPRSSARPRSSGLVADYSKAERELGWKPSTSFDDLIKLMVDADIALLTEGPAAPKAVTYPTATPVAQRQETVPDVLPHEPALTD